MRRVAMGGAASGDEPLSGPPRASARGSNLLNGGVGGNWPRATWGRRRRRGETKPAAFRPVRIDETGAGGARVVAGSRLSGVSTSDGQRRIQRQWPDGTPARRKTSGCLPGRKGPPQRGELPRRAQCRAVW